MAGVDQWQKEHAKVIVSFLQYLNGTTDQFILKGGTALMMCYHLDRFSEDIDLDGFDPAMEPIIADYCNRQGFSYRIAKDTDTVKRYMLDYGAEGKPLKIEVSYRRRAIEPEECARINGILVYTIDGLCAMKVGAYQGRDRIRDLYDLAFICDRYWEQLTAATIAVARTAVAHKGIEQFDYLVKTQQDELVDTSKLADSFLRMYDKLGLLYDEKEQSVIEDYLDDDLERDGKKR